ncbi:MAG: NUDIX domain-containing protein [Clostridia bacterium]|jgi:8-oxo-dGTP diphosphatase|nr:NUDIX domain-containing protein [Clostridia bacterium]
MKYIGSKNKNIEYRKRPGAYAIIKRKEDNKIGIVMNTTNENDFFFLGGGIEKGETEIEALRRELIEESGYAIKNIKEFDKVGSFVYAEDKGYLEVIANVYIAEFEKKIVEPIEKDHKVLWVTANEYINKMSQEWQRYILKEYIEKG